ncbi:hypothetical protein LXL04_016699 [Taraxacum kok-saghyz]
MLGEEAKVLLGFLPNSTPSSSQISAAYTCLQSGVRREVPTAGNSHLVIANEVPSDAVHRGIQKGVCPAIHPLHSDSSLGFTAIPPTPAYLLTRALGFRWHACTASKSLQPLKPLVPSLSVKYFAKSTKILKSLSQIHRSLFPTTLMVSRPHTTRCLPSSPTSPEKMRSPVNNIHSVSLHAPQILLFRFVCSLYFLVFLAFRFVCYDDTGVF